MKQILIRNYFYNNIVLNADEVFINAYKNIMRCKDILDQVKKDSKNAYINGYDYYNMKYRLSHNSFWYIKTFPENLISIFPNTDISLPVVDVTKEDSWIYNAAKLIDNNLNDANNYYGVSNNSYITLNISSSGMITMTDDQISDGNGIYIKNANVTLLENIL